MQKALLSGSLNLIKSINKGSAHRYPQAKSENSRSVRRNPDTKHNLPRQLVYASRSNDNGGPSTAICSMGVTHMVKNVKTCCPPGYKDVGANPKYHKALAPFSIPS